MTPAQARELWANELASGKWKQGTGQLARETDHGTEYCCLGVACELAVREGVIPTYDGEDASLSAPYEPVMDWLGLSDPEGRYASNNVDSNYLSMDNDRGATFKQIAATIRNPPSGLVTQ